MSYSLSHTFACLQDMNIPLWAKRPGSETKIFFLEPKMFMPLLVVLEKKIEANTESQKVFQGMLKVLNLTLNDINLCWCLQTNTGIEFTEIALKNIKEKIFKSLQYWQPQNTLFLGQALIEQWDLSDDSYFATYHPEELVKAPQNKRAAYQVLLSLQQCLHRGVSNA